MRPKEKAIELVDKMYHYQWREKQRAKQCALIAVEEAVEYEKRIIKEIQFLSDIAGHAFRCEGLYWEQVKNEINKL